MEEFDKNKLGQRIKQLRITKGYSQDDLCDKIGIDPPSLSKFENGKNAPSLPTLIKIIDALEVQPNEVFDYSHFKSESELERDLINRYRKLTVEKKQYFYRLLSFIEELN